MNKKFYVKDEDGEEYEVEKVSEEKEVKDEMALTDEEIAALKKLASIADKLMTLASDEMHDEEPEEKEEEKDDEDEEIVDTDSCSDKEKLHDSRKSAASIINKNIKNKDSVADSQLDIADAWAKRYGGMN